MKEEKDRKIRELIGFAVKSMGVAITIIDRKGTLLYYNERAAKILDRKPEYIGHDVYSHHKKAESIRKLEQMLQDFREGRREPFHYQANPYGKTILVTLSPVLDNGKFIGCTQSVQLKDDLKNRDDHRSESFSIRFVE